MTIERGFVSHGRGAPTHTPDSVGEVYKDDDAGTIYSWDQDDATWRTASGGGSVSFAAPGNSAVGDSAAAGSASTATRSDHVHGRESFGATPSTQAMGDAAGGGSATTPSRSDHKHAMPSFAAPGSSAVGDSAAAGTATTLPRSDHVHGREAFGAASRLDGANANGSATTPSRSDHTHGAAITLTEPYAFAVPGSVAVPSGATDYINGFFIKLPSGESASIVGYKAVIRGGTSATVKATKNGSDVTGFTGISVTTTAAGASPTPVALADGDFVQIVVTAVSGSPDNMSFTLYVQRTLKVA